MTTLPTSPIEPTYPPIHPDPKQAQTTVTQTVAKVITTLATSGVVYVCTKLIHADPQVEGALLLLCPIIGDQAVDHFVKAGWLK